MTDSTKFGFCNLANFQVYVDKLQVFEEYLKLAVDTILGIKPERTHVSQFCIENSYKNREIPRNWESDGDGGYWDVMPAHYWLEEAKSPLEVCVLGSDNLVRLDRVKMGRETFSDQNSLVKRALELTSTKRFNEDVLPHLPEGTYRKKDINEALLHQVMASANLHAFDFTEFGEGVVRLTPDDLKGSEGIGYTITQSPEARSTLKIGLCKTYYPK